MPHSGLKTIDSIIHDFIFSSGILHWQRLGHSLLSGAPPYGPNFLKKNHTVFQELLFHVQKETTMNFTVRGEILIPILS